MQDLNITRLGETWGIRVPWDERFTIYVWFDALLTYITGIGYGADRGAVRQMVAGDMHFIGKDITRFHCATWPAMLMAAGVEPPRMVFGHGFVYKKNEATGVSERISKTLGNVIEPMDIVTKFNVEAFRYYFLRECPFPGDGEFSWQRFAEVYQRRPGEQSRQPLQPARDARSRKNYGGHAAGHRGPRRRPIDGTDLAADGGRRCGSTSRRASTTRRCEMIWRQVLDPANQYADQQAPWKLVKTDKDAAAKVLFDLLEPLRAAAILLKPFLPRSAETIYTSFNFAKPWDEVRYDDAAAPRWREDLRVLAELEDGKVKPLFPRIS